jgi:hypothetical protein
MCQNQRPIHHPIKLSHEPYQIVLWSILIHANQISCNNNFIAPWSLQWTIYGTIFLFTHFTHQILIGSSDPRIPGYDPSQVTGWTLFTADARGPTRVILGIHHGTKIDDHRPSTGLWLGHMVKGYTIWLFNSSPWKITMLLIGKPSISMGHLYHGYVTNNQRVYLWFLWSQIHW